MKNIDRRTLLRGVVGAAAGVGGLGLTGCSDGPAGKGSLSVLTPVFATPQGKKVLEGEVTTDFHATFPDVPVRVDYNTWDVLPEKITAGLAGGTLSDLVMVGFGWVPPFAQKGALAELPASLADRSGYLEQVISPARYLGKTYALPLGVDPIVIAYRKDHFAEAGITAPPASFAEFRAAAKRLVRPKAGGGFDRAGIDISSVNLRQLWINALDASGGRLMDDAGRTVLFDDAAGVKALEFMQGLVTDGSTSLDFRSTLPLQSLLKGTSSMMATASSAVGQVAVDTAARPQDLAQIGYFILADVKPSMFVGGSLVAVNKRAKNQDAAIGFLQAVTAKKSSLAVTEPNGYLPPFLDLAADRSIRNPSAGLIRDSLKYSVSEGGTPAWMEIRSTINPVLEGVLTGGQRVPDALSRLRKQAEDAIGRI